jgi:hypothetical protein
MKLASEGLPTPLDLPNHIAYLKPAVRNDDRPYLSTFMSGQGKITNDPNRVAGLLHWRLRFASNDLAPPYLAEHLESTRKVFNQSLRQFARREVLYDACSYFSIRFCTFPEEVLARVTYTVLTEEIADPPLILQSITTNTLCKFLSEEGHRCRHTQLNIEKG